MPNKQALARRAEELRAEMISKTADFEADKLSSAEFTTYMKGFEAENEQVAIDTKTLRAALGFSGGADPKPSGEPAEVETPDHIKQYRDGFAQIKSAVKGRDKEQVAFEFGYKRFGDDIAMKTQGVTGLSGDAASGTTTPSALASGSYFMTGTAGPFIAPEFIPGIVDLRFYENAIAALIPTYACESPIVTYVREATWSNNASPVNEGATKPTSTHSLTRFSEQVGKIANLERVTDELIQDAGYVWSLIQQRLVQGVQRKEEIEILAGSGYPGVNGLLNRTAGFTAPQTVTAVTNLVVPGTGIPGVGAGTDTVASVVPGRQIVGASGKYPTGIQMAEGILQALTDIRVDQFFEPDAIVMNPRDYLNIRLSTDLNGQYLGGSFFGRNYGFADNEATPQPVGTYGLWDKRVVATPAMPLGLVLVGDFADYNRILRRGGLRVDMTNTNGTDFEQNLWTARAEERIGLMVERPELFELIQLVDGS